MLKTKDIQNYTDAELVAIYKEKDNNFYVGELFQRHTRMVFLVCMKYLKDEEKSKDAVMQIFEKLLDDLHRFQVENFKAWLHTVTRNHCLLEIRKQQNVLKKQNEIKKELEINVEYHQVLHLENETNSDTKIENLSKALENLNVEQKTCIELFYLNDKSYDEIAEITGYPLSKVKSYIQNGKRNMKIFLENAKCILLILSILLFNK